MVSRTVLESRRRTIQAVGLIMKGDSTEIALVPLVNSNISVSFY